MSEAGANPANPAAAVVQLPEADVATGVRVRTSRARR
jgi:hypothetical protein